MTNFPYEMWYVEFDTAWGLVFFCAGTDAVTYAQYTQTTLGM
jgi:hypothetical protein